ncbi:hypothetical protein ABIE21_002322 [Conyzicola nivalis]|uniref:Fimbrial assembly protein n=1 Tax=Conyzicola nivalis TaxID=1477021 RepID=A0ABV2QP31_9MICO
MSARGTKEARLVLGASPRVDLLPPEVADRKKGAAVRRALVFGVIGALVLSAGAYAIASWQAVEARVKYEDARLTTSTLLAQQSEYAEVRALTQQMVTVADARQAGAITEIDWNEFYLRVVPTLPAGVTIEGLVIKSGSPLAALTPPTAPGQTVRAANVTFTVSSPSLELTQAWIVAMKSLPEYGGAVAKSVSRGDAGGYTVEVHLAVTDAAYTNRFAPSVDEAVATDVEGEN